MLLSECMTYDKDVELGTLARSNCPSNHSKNAAEYVLGKRVNTLFIILSCHAEIFLTSAMQEWCECALMFEPAFPSLFLSFI